MHLLPVQQGLSSSQARPQKGASSTPGAIDRVSAGAEAGDPGLIPRPGFFGETPTSQLTPTASFTHHGVIPPVLTPGAGDEAYFAAGGKLHRMSPEGTVSELGTEPSLHLSAPLIGPDESLYYRTDAGHLVARRPDGQELWRETVGGSSYYPMGLARDGSSAYSVNVGADGVHTVAVRELATGRPRYELALAPGEELLGMLDEQTMLVTGGGREGHYLQIVRPEGRGRRVEGLDTPEHGPNAWLGPDDQVFVRDARGRLQALEASTGHQNWIFPGPVKDVFASPDGSLLAVMGKQMTRLSPAGDPLWTGQAPGPVQSGSFDARGNFYGRAGGQLAYLTPQGELESTPWAGSARASGSGMLYQVVSPPATPQPGLSSLGLVGSVLQLFSTRRALAPAVRTEGDHRVEAVRFSPKKELLASLQSGLNGSQAAIEEREGRLIVGGVAVRRKA